MIGLSLCLWLGLLAQSTDGPYYTAESLVNAASNTPGPLAPNTFASLYGARMAFATRGITAEDIRANVLPTTLPGTGLRVLIGGQPANIYYVSPTQINLLVPSNLISGNFKLRVVLDGRAGPEIPVVLTDSAPQLFVVDKRRAVAIYLDGSAVSPEVPALPGDIVTLFATGLGRTVPDLPGSRIATAAAEIERIADFRVSLNGEPLDPSQVLYAGLTPGFGGLYQISFRLPPIPADRVEVRIGLLNEPQSVPDTWLPIVPATP